MPGFLMPAVVTSTTPALGNRNGYVAHLPAHRSNFSALALIGLWPAYALGSVVHAILVDDNRRIDEPALVEDGLAIDRDGAVANGRVDEVRNQVWTARPCGQIIHRQSDHAALRSHRHRHVRV